MLSRGAANFFFPLASVSVGLSPWGGRNNFEREGVFKSLKIEIWRMDFENKVGGVHQ